MGYYESSKESGLEGRLDEQRVRIGGCQWDIMRVVRSQDWRAE